MEPTPCKRDVRHVYIKVLKPGLDGTVRSGKSRTAHFCGSFSIKNRSIGKKKGNLCKLQSDLMVLRTVNGFSDSFGSFFSANTG